MVGNELTAAAVLYPTPYRRRDDVHAPAANAFVRLFGRVMPFWYATTLLLTLVNLWLRGNTGPPVRRLLAASCSLWQISIL